MLCTSPVRVCTERHLWSPREPWPQHSSTPRAVFAMPLRPFFCSSERLLFQSNPSSTKVSPSSDTLREVTVMGPRFSTGMYHSVPEVTVTSQSVVTVAFPFSSTSTRMSISLISWADKVRGKRRARRKNEVRVFLLMSMMITSCRASYRTLWRYLLGLVFWRWSILRPLGLFP